MREAARRGEFRVLYVHKVDRLARRPEWSLEIVLELQSLDINFKAVQQPFDLRTPEGKLLFHMTSSLGGFYSDSFIKETNKGKLERSLQGYHKAPFLGDTPASWLEFTKWACSIPKKLPLCYKCLKGLPLEHIRICRSLNA